MTINGANFTVTADTLCNDGSVEKYFTGGAPSGWSLGALSSGSGVGLLKYAPFDVEIIQPQAGLTTANRFYKAYPGIEYSVKIAVYGGDFSALTYSLSTAPSGMSVDQTTGVITWSSPTAGSHNITASVTDGLTTDSVSWTLTVTTNGFLFVDSGAAEGGDGSIGSPFNSIADFYLASEADSTYSDYFVYFRAGTHYPDSSANTAGGGMQWGSQKPVVFLAYPGEQPVFDMTGRYFFGDARCDNAYVDGIRHINVGADQAVSDIFAYRWTGDNTTFINNRFENIANLAGSWNQSYVMYPGGSPQFGAFINNYVDGNNANAYSAPLLYTASKFVIESNEIIDSGNIAFGVKTNNSAIALRGNKAAGAGRGAWLYAEFDDLGAHEVSWNYLDFESGEGYHVAQGGDLPGSNYFIRNTTTSSNFYQEITSSDAMQYETDNVIISSEPNGYTTFSGVAAGKLVQSGNVYNSTRDGFIDVDGLLISGSNTSAGHNGLAGRF